MSGILLPKIHSITLTGFHPLFTKTVGLELPDGPFLIMGGNAMGKTTTLQAIAYAIAGNVDDQIQEDKKNRWNSRYFLLRLQPEQDTEIQVEFSLGEVTMTVRRGIQFESLLGIKIGEDDWIHDSDEAQQIYDSAIKQICGFEADDFRFLVHRLCYLPESRQSLIWDQKAQTRVVMLVCSDFANEALYRELGDALRALDTEKRHLHVDIGHLEEKIARQKQAKKDEGKVSVMPRAQSEDLIEQLEEINKLITAISRRRLDLFRDLKKRRADLSELNHRLEGLQERLGVSEDDFILRTLRSVEKGTDAVALQKLLIYHRCPYCSQQTDELAAIASDALAKGNCPICGQVHSVSEHDDDLDELRAEVAKQTNARALLEDEYKNVQTEIENLTDEERELRAKLDRTSLKLPRIPKDAGIDFDTKTEASANRTLKVYKARYSELEISWRKTKEVLDKVYDDFTASSSIRLCRLLEIASAYGRAFLGHKCNFVATPAKGELGELSYFVPEFADTQRVTPQTCSESERFFLDIAFRMAILELAGELSDSKSTFICETPENALDLAYSDNVAMMFSDFARKGFSILLTANIQTGGIAEPLLRPYPRSKKAKRILNLLEEGTLSQVQKDALPNFEVQLEKIMSARS